MRFATKFDWWIVLALIVGAAVSLGTSTHGWLTTHRPPLAMVLFLWAVWILLLLATLPQYYEVRADGLYIRQGIQASLIPYCDLAEVQPSTDSRGAGVFSLDRIRVVTSRPRTYVIAPADQNGFLDAVASRAPQLERKGAGLSLPFSTPTLT